MHANQPVESDNDDGVVPIARGVEKNRGGITEKLHLLVELYTHKNSQTDFRLDALESNTREQDTRFLELEARSHSLQSSTKELETRTIGTESRLDLEESRSRSFGETAQAFREKTSSLASSIANLEGRADAGEERLSSLEPKVSGLVTAVENLDSETAELELKQVETELRADAGEARLNSLEPKVSGLETAVEKLDSRTAELGLKQGEVELRADTVEARLSSLEPKVSGLETAVENLDSRTTAQGQKQVETELRAKALEHKTTELEDTDTRHSLRTDALENRVKWASWITGHAIFILTVIASVSYWHSSKSVDTAALTFSENLSAVESKLSANIDKHVATIYSTASQRFEEKVSNIDSELSEQIGERFTALDSRLSGQLASAESERSRLLHLNQEAQRKIALLQQRLDENSLNSAELDGGHRTLTPSFHGITKHLLLVDAQFKTDLDAINKRIPSKNEGLEGAAVNMSILNEESWLQAQNPKSYSIQLVGAYRKPALASFIGRHKQSLPLKDLSYFKRVRNGRDWYVLLFGNYQNFQQALNTLEGLPASLQKNGPYIRTYKSIQESIFRT